MTSPAAIGVMHARSLALAGRILAADGLQLVEDALRRLADRNPCAASLSPGGADYPGCRYQRPRGLSHSDQPLSAVLRHAHEHGEVRWTILSLNDPKK